MLVIRHVFGTGTHCIAPSGLPLLLSLFPGLAPWAFLSRPCGASFAPETSLVDTKFTNRSSFLSRPGRPCHDLVKAGCGGGDPGLLRGRPPRCGLRAAQSPARAPSRPPARHPCAIARRSLSNG